MYIPPPFAETDQTTLFEFIERYSFGLLVSQHDGGPLATHLPFLLDRTAVARGRLIGHMARANPQWQQADGTQVLVVFSGPHAYISPSWYNDSNVVPTWNYTAVHAGGRLRAIHDPQQVLRIVEQTVERFESTQQIPWSFDGSTDVAVKLANQIVAFDIEINRLEGKWKLNQNHSAQRQESVIEGLLQTGDADSKQIANLMQINLKGSPER